MSAKPTEFKLLKNFFSLEVCQRATRPLKNGIEIAIHVDENSSLTLTKQKGQTEIIEETPQKPDMTFWIGKDGVKELTSLETEDIGEIGVAIIKLMLSGDSKTRLKSKVHIGTLQLLTHGYLGVLPLGGPTVMKFLASKGFSSIGKIKEAISQLRG
jgi:hypothetical protein